MKPEPLPKPRKSPPAPRYALAEWLERTTNEERVALLVRSYDPNRKPNKRIRK